MKNSAGWVIDQGVVDCTDSRRIDAPDDELQVMIRSDNNGTGIFIMIPFYILERYVEYWRERLE